MRFWLFIFRFEIVMSSKLQPVGCQKNEFFPFADLHWLLMEEAYKGMTDKAEQNGSSLEYLGYYKHMVMELFSGKDDGFLMSSLASPDSVPLELCSNTKRGAPAATAAHFQGGLVAGLSDFDKEKLKGILNESIAALHHEADKILDGILGTMKIEASMNGHLESGGCNKKQGVLPCSSRSQFSMEAPDVKRFQSCSRKVFADFRGHIEKGMEPQEALKRCSNSLMDKLGGLENFLEDYLDAALTKCRPMTNAEKQQLGQKIHKLPANALDRVAEIIQHRKPSPKDPANRILHVNLNEENDVTLWRLYCHVEMVYRSCRQKPGSHSKSM